MKKFIFYFVFLLCSISINAQDVVDFTNMSEVIQCDNMTTNQIYSNIMQNWSNLNGANVKSENSLDYCDKESGIINIKTKIYLGFHKCNIGGFGYDGYCNSIITYKIKDNRYKVTMTTNTISFIWSGNPTPPHVFDINDLYPLYNIKDKTFKKTSNDLVLEKMPNIMNKYFNLCKHLHVSTEDDF